MKRNEMDKNVDLDVVNDFGREWESFDYADGQADEALDKQFLAYSAPINLEQFNVKTAVAADIGAGSGRWTIRLLPYFSLVYALEPSHGANKVLKEKFGNESRIIVLEETVGLNSIPDNSLDLAMSLGVLHHIPDTNLAIREVVSKLKPGGVFLCYLYYKLDDKPCYYRALFYASNSLRLIISRLPYVARRFIAQIIAALVYWPFARLAKLLASKGRKVSNFPLHHYANMPLIMLQNDALDRFGTRLEQRFSKKDILKMLGDAGFDLATLNFSSTEPFWTFSVLKSKL
jgi:SAM-dependent methyltransferase